MKNIISFEKFFEAKDKTEKVESTKDKKDKPKKKIVINKNYTHFAVKNSDSKVYDGWEYPKDYEKKDVEVYAKQDLKDNDWTWSDFKILTVKQCKNRGIDPFDNDNWYKIKA